ncbi:MAG: hypothetical protein KC766_09075, partial [Myxococcales bacterium]|nr:hypothetical protein [Myxococcales bacterium]
MAELVDQLGVARFGHRPRVGDCFCGGGSIPFEAARIGCEAVASDLNPVAALLTWASLNLVGCGKHEQSMVKSAQVAAFDAAQKQIEDWGIERSEEGWLAEAYLYCTDFRPGAEGEVIPLSPSWVISEKYRVCGVPQRDPDSGQVVVRVVEGADDVTWRAATSGSTATIKGTRVVDPFHSERTWPLDELRGIQGLRPWAKHDVSPREDDRLGERLYCIRWRKPDGTRVYRAPTPHDQHVEQRIEALLRERLEEWWAAGFVPNAPMPPDGEKTDEPIRTRGWTHWHHLFTPRQLLTNGLLCSELKKFAKGTPFTAAAALAAQSCGDWNSRLCRWTPQLARSGGIGALVQTFYNQALNPLYTYGARPIRQLRDVALLTVGATSEPVATSWVDTIDAREVERTSDLWVTDPPYADAVNYDELSGFFLAWSHGRISDAFPGFYVDPRQALAVRGSGDDFKRSMVEVYSNLARHMPDNGLQLVMFTHQNPSVWADLGMILWAAGLRVTAAWTVATETPAGGIKKGNYVQGTVLLVLRKRLSEEHGFLDEVYPMVEDE